MNINAFNIDTSPINSSFTATKSYEVVGDPGAVFSMIIQNNSGEYYNFPENTVVDLAGSVFTPAADFTTTPANLFNQQIPETGVYIGNVTFTADPAASFYRVTLAAGNDTVLNKEVFNNEEVFVSEKIEAFAGTSLVFSITHSNAAVVEPSSITLKSQSSKVSSLSKSVIAEVNWPFTLSSSNAVIRRQPVIQDFEFTTTKTTRAIRNTTGATTFVELTDITGLSKKMLVQDAEGQSLGEITNIIAGFRDYGKSTANNHVYEIPVKANDDGDQVVSSTAGTIVVSTSVNWGTSGELTFTGKGSTASAIFNNTRFKINNLKIELDDVVTTTSAAVPDTVIHCTSVDGVRAQSQFTVNGNRTSSTTVVVDEAVTGVFVGQRLQAMSSGSLSGIPTVTKVNADTKTITFDIAQTFVNDATLTFSNSIVKGIGLKNATTDPFVVSISSNDVTVNANQDIESGATVTFVNSSQRGKITGQIEVLEQGDESLTLDLNFDNILNVA